MPVVSFLYRGASSNSHSGTELTNAGGSRLNQLKCAVHPADGVMDCSRAIERDDNLVEPFRHFRCPLGEEKAGSQQSETDVQVTEKNAQRCQVAVQERLASRKDHPSDSQPA